MPSGPLGATRRDSYGQYGSATQPGVCRLHGSIWTHPPRKSRWPDLCRSLTTSESDTIKTCLEFLAIHLQRWRRITEDAARESVKAFYSLHRVRCKVLKTGPRSGGLRATCHKTGASHARRDVFDADDPNRTCNRKRRRRSDDDINVTRRRWKQMEMTTRKRS